MATSTTKLATNKIDNIKNVRFAKITKTGSTFTYTDMIEFEDDPILTSQIEFDTKDVSNVYGHGVIIDTYQSNFDSGKVTLSFSKYDLVSMFKELTGGLEVTGGIAIGGEKYCSPKLALQFDAINRSVTCGATATETATRFQFLKGNIIIDKITLAAIGEKGSDDNTLEVTYQFVNSNDPAHNETVGNLRNLEINSTVYTEGLSTFTVPAFVTATPTSAPEPDAKN